MFFSWGTTTTSTVDVKISPELPWHKDDISNVIKSAFAKLAISNHQEQEIVHDLRVTGALTASWVAIDNNTQQVVGTIFLSEIKVNGQTQSPKWYGIGPIAVLPDFQGNGIGAKLMHTAIEHCRDQLDAGGVVLLGNPEFYKQFEFVPRRDLSLMGVPSQYFQVRKFRGEWPSGQVTYDDAFMRHSW
ncbi:putative N-acetyltransferase YhbS [Yarrowia sp. C11]|nr:putative N-acetyltransferase YhbS [Yarrowia sp. E02]KAG5371275.1 putative N-acetyltransferase YhbS [Yarrowia sp. C11]